MRRTLLLCIPAILSLNGCASWTAVPSKDKDTAGNGYDVYGPHPYLLIVRGNLLEGSPAPGGGGGGADKKMMGTLTTQPASAASEAAPPNETDEQRLARKAKELQDRLDGKKVEGEDGTAAASEFTAKIIYLPDYSKRYRIRTSNFLAKADFQFTFTDGWQLTSVSDKSDNSALVTALPALIGSLLGKPAAAAAAAGGAKPAAIIPPFNVNDFDNAFALYRMDYNLSDESAVVTLTRVPVINGLRPDPMPLAPKIKSYDNVPPVLPANP